MENRFGVKDLFLFLTLAALIALVALGIKQYDRQLTIVLETQTKLQEQTADLARIRRLLERGQFAAAAPATQSGGPPTTDRANPVPAPGAADERVIQVHQADDYAPGDTIVDTFTTPPDKLTPLVNSDQYSQWVQALVQDSLLDRDPNTFAWTPRLATSWTISPDGLTIDFTLRKGVTFSDGEPLTADDVIFTVGMILDEKIEDPRDRIYFAKLKEVTKINGGAGVRFVFKEPYFLNFVTVASTGIMSKKFYGQFSAKDFNESTGLLLGSGPYRLPDPKSWKPEPGKPITLVRNERYWGEPSGPDKLVWRVIELPAARLTEFRNRATDVYTRPTPEQFETMKADKELAGRSNLYSMDVVNAGYIYFGWNERTPEGTPTRFSDVRVRRAMTMLVDRNAIVRDILRGYGTVATGPFHHLSPECDPSIQPLPYDPEAAQRLLAEAGCTKRGGTLYAPDGSEFRFKMLFAANGEVTKRIVSYVRDSFAKAGIIMEPAPTEWSVLLDQTKERRFDAVTMGWGGSIEDDPQQMFSTEAMKGTGDNFVQYSNPKVDAAIAKARVTVNEAERNKVWHEVHRLIADDQPYTFLVADFELIALDGRIKGAVPTKTAITVKTEWYVPAARQKYR